MSVILVVEDEVATQIMLGFMLQRNNDYTVITVENGQEALTYLDTEPVDLIISDINMPEMDGLTMLRQLRADGRYEDLPIIMFTAVGTDQIKKDAEQMGASGFLRKPVSSREISSIVEYYLGDA